MPYKSNGKWKWGNLEKSSKDDLRKTVYWIWKKNGSKGDFSHFWKTGKVNEGEGIITNTMNNEFVKDEFEKARKSMLELQEKSRKWLKGIKIPHHSDKEVFEDLCNLTDFVLNGFIKFPNHATLNQNLEQVIRNSLTFYMDTSLADADSEKIVDAVFKSIYRFADYCSVTECCFCTNYNKYCFTYFARMVWSTIYEGFETDEPSIYVKPSTFSREELDSIFDSKKISIGNLKAFNESIKRWIRLTEK